MKTWKCILCAQKMETPRPPLGSRLCPKCRVVHWERVVDIYRVGGQEDRLQEAERELEQAKQAAASWQEVEA